MGKNGTEVEEVGEEANDRYPRENASKLPIEKNKLLQVVTVKLNKKGNLSTRWIICHV